MNNKKHNHFPIRPNGLNINSNRGKLRVIKKKSSLPRTTEIYVNETALKKIGTGFLKLLPRCKLLYTDNMALVIGNGRKIKTRNPGMADHHICLRGLFVAIEAKMPGKDLDKDQIVYKNDVECSGGIFIVYHSLEELKHEMKKHRLIDSNV